MRDVLLILLGAAVGAAGSTAGYLIVGHYDAKRRARHDCAIALRDLVRLLTTITRPENLTRDDRWQLDAVVLDLLLHGTMAGRDERRRVHDIRTACDAYYDALALPTAEAARTAIQETFERLEELAQASFTWISQRATR